MIDVFVSRPALFSVIPTTIWQEVASRLSMRPQSSARLRISQRLDMQLLEHPLTDLSLCFEIYCRIMYVSAATYSVEATPTEKRWMLLRLREHYHEFLRLPERVQECLRPLWLEWVDVLNEEEAELERAGHA